MGDFVTGYGQYMGGRAQNEAARYNARLLQQQAAATRIASESETEMMVDEKRRMMATQEAIAAKSGGAMEGTPLMVLTEQAGIMQRNILEQRRNREIEARGLLAQAEMSKWEGKQAKRAGTILAIGSGLRGAGQIAGYGMGGG